MSVFQRGDAIVVTGAAQGIGRAIAMELAKRGARLALWDVFEEGLAETSRLCAELGVEVLVQAVDVGVHEPITKAADAAVAHFGAVFGLVNNAGIFPRVSIADVTPDLWRSVLGVNLMGTVFCSQAFARQRAARPAA